MDDQLIRRAAVLIMLGLGISLLLAGILGLIFRLVSGSWQTHIEFITLASLILSLPISYQIWRRFFSWRL